MQRWLGILLLGLILVWVVQSTHNIHGPKSNRGQRNALKSIGHRKLAIESQNIRKSNHELRSPTKISRGRRKNNVRRRKRRNLHGRRQRPRERAPEVFRSEIVLIEPFTNDLNDPNSAAFMTLALDIENALLPVYRKFFGRKTELKVISFRNGTIIVTVELEVFVPAGAMIDVEALANLIKITLEARLGIQVDSVVVNTDEIVTEGGETVSVPEDDEILTTPVLIVTPAVTQPKMTKETTTKPIRLTTSREAPTTKAIRLTSLREAPTTLKTTFQPATLKLGTTIDITTSAQVTTGTPSKPPKITTNAETQQTSSKPVTTIDITTSAQVTTGTPSKPPKITTNAETQQTSSKPVTTIDLTTSARATNSGTTFKPLITTNLETTDRPTTFNPTTNQETTPEETNTVPLGPVTNGDISTALLTVAGACEIEPPADGTGAALGSTQFGEGQVCSTCLLVTGPNGTAMVMVVDKFGTDSGLQVSPGVMGILDATNPTSVSGTWQPIICPTPGNIVLNFRDLPDLSFFSFSPNNILCQVDQVQIILMNSTQVDLGSPMNGFYTASATGLGVVFDFPLTIVMTNQAGVSVDYVLTAFPPVPYMEQTDTQLTSCT